MDTLKTRNKIYILIFLPLGEHAYSINTDMEKESVGNNFITVTINCGLVIEFWYISSWISNNKKQESNDPHLATRFSHVIQLCVPYFDV